MRKVYEIKSNSHLFIAVDISNNQPVPLSQIPLVVRKRAAKEGWLIEQKVYSHGSLKAGKTFFQFIKNKSSVAYLRDSAPAQTGNYSTTVKPPKQKVKKFRTVEKVITKTVKTLSERNFAKETYVQKSISELLVPSTLPTKVPNNSDSLGEVVQFIKDSVIYKPEFLKLSSSKWRLLVRAAVRGENTIIVGDKGEGKTMTVVALANALKRPLFKFNFGNMQDAQTALIGKTHFDSSKGTFFSKSYFVDAISTPNSVILLDEFSRASDDATNIMFSVLDSNQRYLRLNDEVNSPIVEVAEGVCFIATANIGHEYTGTRTIDAALMDRFSTKLEVDHLTSKDRANILEEAFPGIERKILDKISDIATSINNKVYSQDSNINISTPLSTRKCLACVKLINDGFDIMEAIKNTIYTEYSDEGGSQSERTSVKQIVQGTGIHNIDLKSEKIYKSQEWTTTKVDETVTEQEAYYEYE